MRKMLVLGLLALFTLLAPAAKNAQAQDALPPSWHLDGITHIYQGWNNCGPATLTMGLSYFGHEADQYPAAQWLKPNSEDKNVSPFGASAKLVQGRSHGSLRVIHFGRSNRWFGSGNESNRLVSGDCGTDGHDAVSKRAGRVACRADRSSVQHRGHSHF